MTIQVLVVDDHAIVRSGLSVLINAEQDMRVIAAAENGREAFEKAMNLRPHVILMDLSMPVENGLQATTRIKKELPEVEILILTMHDDKEYLFRVLQAGASGYVLKNAQEMDVMSAIRTVHRGEAYLYPNAAKSLITEYLQRVQSGEQTEGYRILTDREQEILTLIAKGYSNKEIADLIYVSVKTVEAHKSKIMEKLELKTRHELVQYALKKGLLELEA